VGEENGRASLAKVIAQFYDLGDVSAPEPVAAAHQRRHRKLIVETSRGKFLVKTYKRDPYVLDALRFQHRLSDHLHEHQLPVAKIQEARNGKRIVEVDTWAIELQEFVEGTPMHVSSETLEVSAHALGRFHRVCHDFPRPERDARMWRFSQVPRSNLAQLYAAAQREGDSPALTSDCNAIALFLHDANKELNYEARNQFETGLIHGDWHGGNLIFQKDKLMAIVDLEFAGDGCYLEDLSYAISNLCIRTTVREERLSKRTDIVLDCYQHYRTLSFAEQIALYYAIGVKHVATVAYQVQQNGQVAGLQAREWMARLRFQCDWLSERARAVRWG
jgi:Ser/Thr protein kinase RdoA (MazF antagonist)